MSFLTIPRFCARKAAVSGIAVAAAATGLLTLAPTSAQATTPRETAKSMMSGAHFACFDKIVSHESGWNHKAVNKSSGAYGLVQALPAHKMASAGADWKDNPRTQIKWGLDYMNSRYGSPCQAWDFWQKHHWY